MMQKYKKERRNYMMLAKKHDPSNEHYLCFSNLISNCQTQLISKSRVYAVDYVSVIAI